MSAVLLIGGGYGLFEVWTPQIDAVLPDFGTLPQYAGGRGVRAAVLGELVYVCGGWNRIGDNWRTIGTCWTVNINGGQLSQTTTMTVSRAFHTLDRVGDRLIATGGWERSYSLNSVEFYSPEKGWETATWTLPFGDYRHCIVPLSNEDEILFLSGLGSRFGRMYMNKINIETGVSETIQPPLGATGAEHYCAREGDSVYLTEDRQVWQYSIAKNSWMRLAETSSTASGIVVLSGEVTFFGYSIIQVLNNGAWKKPEQELQADGTGSSPAIIALTVEEGTNTSSATDLTISTPHVESSKNIEIYMVNVIILFS